MRHKLTTPTRKLTVHIPEDVAARAEIYLISPALGKVPFGAWQKFVSGLIVDFFTKAAAHQTGTTEWKAPSQIEFKDGNDLLGK